MINSHFPNLPHNSLISLSGSISQVDLVPTLLDLVGQPAPGHLQGESRTAVLRGEETLDGNDVFIQLNDIGEKGPIGNEAVNRMAKNVPLRSVVSDDRWKLNLSPGDQCELYDLGSDPYEMNNMFNDPGQKDRIRDLTARIRLWQHATGDSAPLPSV